jgi:hypothetical protein
MQAYSRPFCCSISARPYPTTSSFTRGQDPWLEMTQVEAALAQIVHDDWLTRSS